MLRAFRAVVCLLRRNFAGISPDARHLRADAIPAKGLPKMLVDPAISAIEGALSAALPPITTAVKTGS